MHDIIRYDVVGGKAGYSKVYVAAIVAVATSVVFLACTIAFYVVARPTPFHSVLYVRFTQTTTARGAPHLFELWTDSTAGRARLSIVPEQGTLYYERSEAGVWYTIGRTSGGEPWRRVHISAPHAVSLLSESGVRRLFAHLEQQARPGTVTQVGLRSRMATVFVAQGVSWPYRYAGPMTIWLDTYSGLPLQFRMRVNTGTRLDTYVTVVDQLRTISSSSLSSGFFKPPDEGPALWERIVAALNSLRARFRPSRRIVK